jgi:SAM-dependent methyltransferase
VTGTPEPDRHPLRDQDQGDPEACSGDEEPLGRDPSRVDLGSSGEYGMDAPGVVRSLSYVALGAFAIMGVAALANMPLLMGVALIVGVAFTIVALAMVSSSRTGKLRERVRIVDAANLSADDYVLDVGCGRGLLLVEAARRVPDGLAVGVDIWSQVDQSRNVASAPLDNSVIERVEDRVDVVTGDGRRLPYVDGAFDAVVSSMVLHNIPDSVGRARIIREAARVLRPGGQLVVVDMLRTAEYVAVLRALRWSEVSRSRRVWRMFPPVRYVTGTKPHPETTPGTTPRTTA